MSHTLNRAVLAGALVAISALAAETGGSAKIEPVSISNLKRYVTDIDKSFVIYRDVFGFEPVRPEPGKFAVNPDGQKATNTPGASYRTASFKLPGTTYNLELVEYKDIKHAPQPDRKQYDIGDQALVITVRDFDGTLDRAKKAGLKIVTVGGEPIVRTGPNNTSNRAITFHDPDGFQTEIVARTPIPETDLPATANVLSIVTDITVADLDKAVAFYRDVLGLEMGKAGEYQRNELTMKIIGNESATAHPSFRTSSISAGGKRVGMNLIQFKDTGTQKKPDFLPQNPGSSGISLGVKDVTVAGQVLKGAGADIISVGGGPIPNPRGGGLMYIRDIDGTLIEVSQRAN